LSSQETDAHLRRNLRSLPGQPLNLTLEFLSCQLRFRKLSGRLRSWHSSVSKHQGSPSVSLVATVLASTVGTRETFESRFLGGSPGPGPPSGVPSPSGQDELYGWCVPSSNRGSYPTCPPVLTCPNQFCYPCDWRFAWCSPPRPHRHGRMSTRRVSGRGIRAVPSGQ
jgi:hypothetical protein